MTVYRADTWVFDSQSKKLNVQGSESRVLSHKAAELLQLLCEKNGQLLDRYFIIEQLWQGNLEVGEHGLRQLIWQLRKELPGSSQDPAIINEPRKGYRLRDPVSIVALKMHRNLVRRVILTFSALILISVTFWLTTISRDDEMLSETIAAQPFTTDAGYEESMVVNSAEDRFVYSSNRDGSFDIYSRSLDDTTLDDEKLIAREGDQGGTALNYDGSLLAYLSTTENPQVDDVVIRRLRDGVEQVVAQQYAPKISRAPYGLAWHPAENKLAFSGMDAASRRTAIKIYDYESQEITRLTSPTFVDMHPQWSPDGRKLTFVRIHNPERSSLNYYDLESESDGYLIEENKKIYGHSWLSDRFILCSIYESGFFRPYIIDAITNAYRPLSVHGNFKFPYVSDTDVFYVRSSLERQIHAYDYASDAMQLTTVISSKGNESMPHAVTSQGGLVFVSDRTGSKELWRLKMNERQAIQLTSGGMEVSLTSISESEQYALVRILDQQGAAPSLQVIDINTGQLVHDLGIDSVFGQFVSADRYIAYLQVADEGRSLWLYDLHTQRKHLWVDRLWTMIGANLATGTVYYAKDNEFWAAEATLSPPEPRNIKLPSVEGLYSVGADGVLYYFKESEGQHLLISHDLSSGEEQRLLVMENVLYEKVESFSIDPLRETIYLNVIPKRESDIYRAEKAAIIELAHAIHAN